MIIGAHFSIAKGFLGALKDAVNTGANTAQIFSKNPMAAKYRLVHEDEAKEISEWNDREKIKKIFIHASYLINASRPMDEKDFAFRSLFEDIKNIDALGGEGVILHMGKSVDIGEAKAEETFIKNIRNLAEKTKDLRAKIIIENTAGAGTELGFHFEDIGRILKKIGFSDKVKMCLDTAHSFGAGYDWRNEEETKKNLKKLDELIGIENIACVHLNDSKKILDSRADRHADIGEGEIGEAGLRNFVKTILKMKDDVPFILETPGEKVSYEEQIKKVKGWAL